MYKYLCGNCSSALDVHYAGDARNSAGYYECQRCGVNDENIFILSKEESKRIADEVSQGCSYET